MKTSNILNNLVSLIVAIVIGAVVSAITGLNPNACIGLSVLAAFALAVAFPNGFGKKVAYNLVYNPAVFAGDAYEEIFYEIMYMNKTISKGLVRLLDNINTEVFLTEATVTRVSQQYKASPVTGDKAGGVALADKILTPFKFMIYDEFTPDDVVKTRLGKPNSGSVAFPKVTDEYQQIILNLVGQKEAELMDSRFWNAAKAATAVAAAALTPGAGQNAIGAAEQAYIAAAPVDFIDGILTKLIMSFSATKRRIKVAGTTITASNIATEYAKVYAAILPKILASAQSGDLIIFAPYSHLQLINQFNLAQTYRDLFTVTNGNYAYSTVRIEFVPLPENAIVAGIGQNLIWGCDVTDSMAMVNFDKLANNSEDYFLKAPYTQESAYVLASQFVVYVG